MTTQPTASAQLRPAAVAILTHAIRGTTPNGIAAATGVATTTVRAVLEEHGGDTDGWKAALEAHGHAVPEPAQPAGYREPGRVVLAPVPPVTSPAAEDPHERALLDATRAGDDQAIRAALAAIKASKKEREKADADRKRQEEAAHQQREYDQAVADIERLGKLLTAAKEKARRLRPKGAPKPRGVMSAKQEANLAGAQAVQSAVAQLLRDANATEVDVRTWAVAQELIAADRRGRMSRDLIDRYLAAQEQTA